MSSEWMPRLDGLDGSNVSHVEVVGEFDRAKRFRWVLRFGGEIRSYTRNPYVKYRLSKSHCRTIGKNSPKENPSALSEGSRSANLWVDSLAIKNGSMKSL